jgi:hypothetical protein
LLVVQLAFFVVSAVLAFKVIAVRKRSQDGKLS